MEWMTIAICLAAGLAAGGLIGYLYAKSVQNALMLSGRDEAGQRYNDLDREYAAFKAEAEAKLKGLQDGLVLKDQVVAGHLEKIDKLSADLKGTAEGLVAAESELKVARQLAAERAGDIVRLKDELETALASWHKANSELAISHAQHDALQEKLATQKEEMEVLGKRFNLEFENIANKILETKSEKFTELNKKHLHDILEPLGKNIVEFKTKVEEVYDKESKERFSLGEKVRELAELNQMISDEARNLTRALKGEAKTQGRWGEMILENILERSGLVKGREYFMEHELRDDGGNALRSDVEGRKMRPDAVINYPENRKVIIDSKVSLNAFTRMAECDDPDERKAELQSHVGAVKNHIIALSAKGYDDYDKSLDFVMMFIPSEPAYHAALQGDPDLWGFAYDKRILLLSPTNLIISLKLVADLWKRENHNRNAAEIADRGGKLYDKFVGFVENLKLIGNYLGKASDKYEEAYKQLYTGNDNLVVQTTKLKKLGIRNKKSLAQDLVLHSDAELPALEDQQPPSALPEGDA